MKRNSAKMEVRQWNPKRITQQRYETHWKKTSDVRQIFTLYRATKWQKGTCFLSPYALRPVCCSLSFPSSHFQLPRTIPIPRKTSMGQGANFRRVDSVEQYIMQPLVFLQEQECNARGKKASSKKVWPPKLSYHGNPPGTKKKKKIYLFLSILHFPI